MSPAQGLHIAAPPDEQEVLEMGTPKQEQRANAFEERVHGQASFTREY